MSVQLSRLPWEQACEVYIEPYEQHYSLSVGYDREGGLLYLETPNLVECPYGINIDNGIILDLDSRASLRFVECICQLRHWPRDELCWPRDANRWGRIVFKWSASSRSVFVEPDYVSCQLDHRNGVAAIRWGTYSESSVIRVGPDCVACLCRGKLVGFIFIMPPATRKKAVLPKVRR